VVGQQNSLSLLGYSLAEVAAGVCSWLECTQTSFWTLVRSWVPADSQQWRWSL